MDKVLDMCAAYGRLAAAAETGRVHMFNGYIAEAFDFFVDQYPESMQKSMTEHYLAGYETIGASPAK